eukprot:14869-Heterococcus_DN1.PRE.1
MEAVSSKVTRAEALLSNLVAEKDRWSHTSHSFDTQMRTLIGDCLLSAAFVTYCGAFDYRTRTALVAEWRTVLDTVGVAVRSELSLIDYLSKPADRLAWSACGLPNDDLCAENAIILERFNRFPLVIDPSGQATAFLLARYRDRKIATTSFLDAGFMKTLASAVRFGTPLLVRDVERVDPVLNPVLNKELQRTGGRTLVRLGSEDVDFSPRFLIVLTTRDPAAQFTPDLCSRVTVVNFTVTPASLRSQALGLLLRAERPDVDKRRTQILQLQGEQSVKLRQLEERLLDTISAVQVCIAASTASVYNNGIPFAALMILLSAYCTILEDDTVVLALEALKRETREVAQEGERTQAVMSEVQSTSDAYLPLARAVARMFFAMEALSSVHYLYQFSLQFYLDILSAVLAQSAGIVDGTVTAAAAAARLQKLKSQLFAAVAQRVTRALLHDDKLVFTLRLAQIYLETDITASSSGSSNSSSVYWDALLQGAAAVTQQTSTSDAPPVVAVGSVALTQQQSRDVAALCTLPAYAPLRDTLQQQQQQWSAFMTAAEPETAVPAESLWLAATPAAAAVAAAKPSTALLRLLLVSTLRPDRALAAATAFIAATL